MLSSAFLQILTMSFTGAIVIVFVLLARLLLKKAPKAFSYALWTVVLFRLICPISFESAFSLLPTKANPIGKDIVYIQMPQIDAGAAILNDSVNVILPAATPEISANPLQIWVYIFSVVWVIGIAMLLAYSLLTLLQLNRRLKTATPYKDNILLSHEIETAFVLGVFRPKIYLPANLIDEQRNYILLHEQTHIKRFDHLMKVLSFVVLCLHWFNPLVWIAFFESSKDMEMSCDEAVVKQLGNEVKKDYSTSLLTLATGRRMVGGTPLAFGEGDTKARVKNVLNYREPNIWVVLAAGIALVFVVIGFTTNPKEGANGVAGVNASILAIDKENQTMTVRGMEPNSPIGDACIVSWENARLLTLTSNREPKELSIDEFAIGDYVVLSLDEIQESYPTKAKAKTIQLQPKGRLSTAYPAKELWNARTQYIGNHSEVGKLIGLLPVPMGVQYDHFELQTAAKPYKLEIVYSLPTELLAEYDTEHASIGNSFKANALLLLALIENADEIQASLTDGSRKVSFTNGREWANHTVNGDVRDYAKSPETVQKLINFMGAGTRAETVAAEYSITKQSKRGEVLLEFSSERQQLAEDIIMNALVKSAAWEGVDISTLEECYRIRQTLPETGEVHDYYAYRLKDGTPVLQSGTVGRYSSLSDDLYESLEKHVIYADVHSDAKTHQIVNYSQSLTAEELKQTEALARTYFTTEAPYYEGVVFIGLMPNDYDLYNNTGIEGEYEAGNIIIYKVLTGRDKRDHKPERSISIARSSKNAAWKVINQGY